MAEVSPEDIQIVRASHLFDADWYLGRYPDVKVLGLDAAEHYLGYGARLNRDPSPRFDGVGYCELNPDVIALGINPLLHYLKWGKEERRAIFSVASGVDAAPRHPQRLPRIIYESHNFKLQGAPNSLFEIAAGVRLRRRFQPTLVSGAMGPIAPLAEQRDIDCVTHFISAAQIKSGADIDRLIQRLAKFYVKMQAALVHVNTLQNFHCIKAAHAAGIPCIWNIRESEAPETYYDDFSPEARALAYSAFADCDAVVFVAEATRSLWQSRLNGVVESLTIPNGIDVGRMMQSLYGTSRPAVRASLELGEDDVLVLSVGTVIERKGQMDLVDAVRQLDGTAKRKLVLALVGFNDSDYSAGVASGLGELEAGGLRVVSVRESTSEEERARVAELYLAADVFVLTSRVESYPRVTLEAMHFGLAIISTPCFGVCEQLVEGVSGLYYDYGDTAALSRLLRLLCQDGDRRRALGAAAHERLDSLNSYDSMLDAYESLYGRVLDRHGRSASGRPR